MRSLLLHIHGFCTLINYTSAVTGRSSNAPIPIHFLIGLTLFAKTVLNDLRPFSRILLVGPAVYHVFIIVYVSGVIGRSGYIPLNAGGVLSVPAWAGYKVTDSICMPRARQA